MKRFFITVVLIAILAAGTAFADHPDGWGIGLQWGGNTGRWDGFKFGVQRGASLSLKIPSIPIFFTIDTHINKAGFALGVAGDYYFIEKTLVPDINLGWYLGGGAGAFLGIYNKLFLAAEARLPVGINWQMPLDADPLKAIEVYLQVVPTLGLSLSPDFEFPYGHLRFDLGFRVWI